MGEAADPAVEHALLGDLRTLWSRLGLPEVLGDMGAVGPGLTGARAAVENALADVDLALAAARARLAVVPTPADATAWTRLEEVCRSLEKAYAEPPTLQARLAEGRMSLSGRMEDLIRSRLLPEVEQARNGFVARIPPGGLDALQAELPAWGQAWGAFSLAWLDVDLDRTLDRLWHPWEGDLPVPPPPLPPLEVTAEFPEPPFPSFEVTRDHPVLAAGVYEHARSWLYGLLSFGGLLGLTFKAADAGPLGFAVVGLGAVAAVVFGYSQAHTARKAEVGKAREELRVRAEATMRATLQVWMDRAQARLAESTRHQLHRRRMDLRTWYRTQVHGWKTRSAEEAERRRAAAEEARRELPGLEARRADLARALELLDRPSSARSAGA